MPERKARDLAVLREYFSNYPPFQYNENVAATSEFYRMCDGFRWEREDDERKLAHELFRDALTKQFNSRFGTDANSLEAWQNLCAVLNVDPVPNELKKCRKIVTNTHANLVDLVQGDAVIFPTVVGLSEYTKRTGKYFPRDNINAGELLNHLLRHILNPSLDANRSATNTTKGQRGRGRGRGRRGRGQGRGGSQGATTA